MFFCEFCETLNSTFFTDELLLEIVEKQWHQVIEEKNNHGGLFQQTIYCAVLFTEAATGGILSLTS